METNSNLQIALRVAGTKQRRAGFAPLVTVGVLAGDEGANMYRSTMVAERPAYVVKHASGYILYQLIDRGAKPFDADANGLLSIALTISSNAQLADGKSPFSLLDEVYRKFVETYMEQTSDGRLSFLDTDTDNDIFREIVSHYKLEKRHSTYIPMDQQGLTGVVCVPQDKLAEFFINTQYKEFASFKEIEIGVNCQGQVTTGLDKLQIPLPLVSYEVWVNNVKTGRLMQSLSDSYFVSAKSTVFHAYEGVEFTLREVLEAQGNLEKNNAHIHLDYKTYRIYCDLRKKDIFYELEFDWKDDTGQGKNVILSAIKNGKVKVQLGTRDISKLFFEEAPRVTAVDIINKGVTFNPSVTSDYSFQGQVALDDVHHKAVIQIIVNRRNTFQPPFLSSVPNKESNRTDRELHEDGKDMKKNSYVLPQTPRKKGFKSFLTGLILGAIIGVAATLLLIGNGNNMEGKGYTNSIMKKLKNNLEYKMTVLKKAQENKESPKPLPAIIPEAKQQQNAASDRPVANNAPQVPVSAIWNMVNLNDKASLNNIKNVWGPLSQDQKKAIIAIYSMASNDQNLNDIGKSNLNDIKDRSFSSFKDVQDAINDIKEIVNNPYNYNKQ
jgi:hypothetical protein